MSLPIRKILVPLDFSSHAERALDYAVDFARAFGAEIHLLHCLQMHPALTPYGIPVPESFEHDQRQAALARLAECRARVVSAGLGAQEHVTVHAPSLDVPALAEKIGADLIVMGTRGLTGLKHLLLGSVTERTIRQAPCPVLTVRASESGSSVVA